jgi:hypothetical protein
MPTGMDEGAMTREQSDANEAYNRDVIGRCEHDPHRAESGAVVCRQCGCRFAAILRPTLLQPAPYDFDDD